MIHISIPIDVTYVSSLEEEFVMADKVLSPEEWLNMLTQAATRVQRAEMEYEQCKRASERAICEKNKWDCELSNARDSFTRLVASKINKDELPFTKA